ncbi:restriction endonuclease [Priestia megaterium]|uniref:restriction endonuclease n=1 Tax=Priestia megaterium TaxID=1404 RepID=UPI001C45321B|nr:restriction endonuclease [Priestia megaterium]MBV6734533.1 restriction endonuclease [Priestia megaterium]
MLFDEKDIDFKILNGTQFEDLCYELLENNGFFNLDWIKGGGDRGRDIVADINIDYEFLGKKTETWHFECKNHSTGIGEAEIHEKIGWALANLPDKLVFLVSTNITPDGKLYISKMQSRFKPIYYIEGKILKKFLLKRPALIEKYFMNDYRKVLRNSIREFQSRKIKTDSSRLEFILSDDKLISSYELNELAYLLYSSLHSNINSDVWNDIYDEIIKSISYKKESLLEVLNISKLTSRGAGTIYKENWEEKELVIPDDVSKEEEHYITLAHEQEQATAYDYTIYDFESLQYIQMKKPNSKILLEVVVDITEENFSISVNKLEEEPDIEDYLAR